MKEYLLERDGKYELHKGGIVPDGAIEVPEGANHLVKTDAGGLIFWKHEKVNLAVGLDIDWDYEDGCLLDEYLEKWPSSSIIWSRFTQPDELPFVDDLTGIQLNLVPKHSHYFKDVSDIDEIDVYEVLHRFGVTDPCLQHIVKKALCAGERGHKDFHTDLKNIAETAQRMLEIHGL